MRFSTLPLRLKLYIGAQPLLLAPVLCAALALPGLNDWTLVGALLAFTVIFSTWKTELTILQGRVTPTFAVVCLAMLLQGAHAAVLCAGVGAVVGSLVRPSGGGWRLDILQPPAYQVCFNTANCVLSCAAAALAFHAASGSTSPEGLTEVIALTAFTSTYFLVNTVGVAAAISLQRGHHLVRAWRESFLWTAPAYFASASAAAGIEAAHRWLGASCLLLLPPLYLIYYFHRLYVQNLRLFAEKSEQDRVHIDQLGGLNHAIIASLAMAIEAKDRVTCSHINRVQHYAVALARAAGIEGPDFDAVATGALVHDIGKLGIPDRILGKPGKLTPEEFKRIQSHVAIGAEILSPIPFPFPVVDVVRTHHERWDGLGYPAGLKGEEIPIGGRIIAIVDVFDALTSDRPYRRALPPEKAVDILREGAGKQFDAALVERFIEVLPSVMEEIARMEAEHSEGSETQAPMREGASALAQISQTAVEMAAVSDVAHSLAERETVEQIVNVVVSRALALLPADTVVLYLTDPDGEELTAVAIEGRYRQQLAGMTIQVGEGAAGWVAKNQQPRINVCAATDVARRFDPEETVELSSVTAVPMGQGEKQVGVLAVYTQAYGLLTEHHVQVLSILAEHAAGAIQGLRRFQQSEDLALKDPLTGLANSRSLVRHLERLIDTAKGEEGGSGFSLVMLDLDHFKQVNDRLGHLRGDELLRQVADLLRKATRDGDVVSRYAGDEFVLLLPGAAPAQAERIAQRLRKSFQALPAFDGEVAVGASIGVASFPEDAADGPALIKAADERMYRSKWRGRSDVFPGQVTEARGCGDEGDSGDGKRQEEAGRLHLLPHLPHAQPSPHLRPMEPGSCQKASVPERSSDEGRPDKKLRAGGRTRVLCVEDEPMMARFLAARIQEQPDLELVALAENAKNAFEFLQRGPVDVVVLDHHLGGATGMHLLHVLSLWYEEGPGAACERPAVLFCTGSADENFEIRAREMGAQGVIAKERVAADLLPALRSVATGGSWFPQSAPGQDSRMPGDSRELSGVVSGHE